MRIAVVGSRDFPELDRVSAYVESLSEDDVIVTGGAKGVDQEAAWAAGQRGLKLIVYPANWALGKSAGFQRNVLIVREAEKLVAFHDGFSRGTAHSIRLARAKGIPTIVLLPNRAHPAVLVEITMETEVA